MKRRKNGWTEEEDNDLLYMISQNFTRQQISEVLGKKPNTVSHRMSLLGVKTSPKCKDGLYLCCVCRTYKAKEEYHNNAGDPNGIQSACKLCTRQRTIDKYNAVKEELFKKVLPQEKTKEEAYGKPTRVCTVCKIEKDINEFNWEIKYKRVKCQCRNCQNEKNKIMELKRLERRGY